MPDLNMMSIDWNGLGGGSAVFRIVEFSDDFDGTVDDSMILGSSPGPMLAWDGTNPITSIFDGGAGKYKIRQHDGWDNDSGPDLDDFIYPTASIPLGADFIDDILYITDSGSKLYAFSDFDGTVVSGFPLDLAVTSVSSLNGSYNSIWIDSSGNLHGSKTTSLPDIKGAVARFNGISVDVDDYFLLVPDTSVSERATGLILDDSANVIVVQDQRPPDIGGLSKDFKLYNADFSQDIDDSFSTSNYNYDLTRRIAARTLPKGNQFRVYFLGL